MATNEGFVLPTEVKGFRDYFYAKAATAEIAAALGYAYSPGRVALPMLADVPSWAGDLAVLLDEMSARVPLESEQARREMMVAPMMHQLVLHSPVLLRLEFAISVAPHLKGKLDYLLTHEANLLVVEAKMGDPVRGVRQVVAQLAALDLWVGAAETRLFAALTLGETWQFAVLDRATKQITLDNRVFSVPDNLGDLLRVILGIVYNGTAHDTAI